MCALKIKSVKKKKAAQMGQREIEASIQTAPTEKSITDKNAQIPETNDFGRDLAASSEEKPRRGLLPEKRKAMGTTHA